MTEKRNVTNENITKLGKDEIFVFGSNESGIHGAGAAKTALGFGAIEGLGYGVAGQTFAIPTKSWHAEETLPIAAIECFITRFTAYVTRHPEKKFLITQVGCGLAGYTPQDIAPVFSQICRAPNVWLPQSFWDVIDKNYDDEIINHMSIQDDGQGNEVRDLS